MNFADGIRRAYDTKWSYINTFSVFFELPPKLLSLADWNDFDNESIQLNIISVDTPQYSNAPIEQFVANKWNIHNGRDELYKFTITFRDEDQLKLYRKFTKMYHATREQYYDDIKMWIAIYKDADWLDEVEAHPVVVFEGAMIDSVSQVQFSNNTENQIAEFSVGFKAPVVTPF